jgi:anti-sigma B factor antagonist
MISQETSADASQGSSLDTCGKIISIDSQAGTATVSLRGVLDVLTVPEIRKDLDALVACMPKRVIVDFSELRLIDSCGLGAIASLYKRTRANRCDLTITGARDQPLALLKLLRFDRVMMAMAA